jgi:hypothetical protein
MITKKKKENFIKYLYPFQFSHNKGTIMSFLSDIFVNFQKRSNNNFDTYTFQELIGLPMIVSDKLYFTFTSHQEKQLTYQEFSSGIYDLLFGDIDDKMSIVFDLLDFDGDGVITIEDVFLILSHFHLIDNTTETIHILEKLISNFFGNNKHKLDKENCFNIKKNFDVLLLTLLFLNKYTSVVSEGEIYQYEKMRKTRKGDKGGFVGYNIYTVDDYEDMEYKPSQSLFSYLETTEFGHKKKKNFDYEDSDSEEDLDSDDEDLDALYEFSIDYQELRDRFINQCSYEPRLLTSTFSCSFFQEERAKMKEQKKEESVKLLDDILMNQAYKKMKFKEKRKNENRNDHIGGNHNSKKNVNKNSKKNLDEKKDDKSSKNVEDDNISVGNMTGNRSTSADTHTGFGGIRRAVTNFGGFKKANSQMRNRAELILYKDEKLAKQVKIILVGHYIFYYKNNRGNFLYKKIMPINSLFVRKKKKDNIVIFSLVSFLHNLEQKKNYYCDKIEDANKFYSKFNKSKMFRDIKKEYYFKVHIGEGQFGQVLLAERNTDNKKLAVKLVQKGTQSIEEYKVNRWEIDIFKLLQNIQHPNVVQCIDLFEYESQIFFVYEYVAGGDLRKICKELKLFPQYYTINTILKFSMQMIEGMRVLHKYGVIHRDIKTTNMVVDIYPSNKKNITNSGWELDYSNIDNSVVKVIDFGLSRILGKFENSTDPYGSLCFKAPELIKHDPYDFKVDVWAIGITIYYLVYKELPFEKGSKEDIKYGIVHENESYPRNNFIMNPNPNNYYDGNTKIKKLNNNATKSSILYSMIKDCLEKNPEERLSIDQLSDKYTPIIQTIP